MSILKVVGDIIFLVNDKGYDHAMFNHDLSLKLVLRINALDGVASRKSFAQRMC